MTTTTDPNTKNHTGRPRLSSEGTARRRVISLSPRLDAALVATASELGSTVSGMVRVAVTAYVARYAPSRLPKGLPAADIAFPDEEQNIRLLEATRAATSNKTATST